MKTRQGFVSNSSSSSFIVYKNTLSEKNVRALLAYNQCTENVDNWNIHDYGDSVGGNTTMDNGLLNEYLEIQNINTHSFIWT